MRHGQPLPRTWLMTDEREDERLWDAIERLPARSGIVFRHYSLPADARRALFREVRIRARRRGLVLLLGGASGAAPAWGADGWHGPGRGRGLHSAPVHDFGELRAAERGGAALLFVSPVYRTRSHPNAPGLGEKKFSQLVRQAQTPVIALGGVDRERWRRLRLLGAYGWAGIDAWSV